MATMASSTAIDTAATGDGLSTAAQARSDSIAAGTPTTPVGSHIAGAPAALTAALGGHLGALTTSLAAGAAAAATSVASYQSAEDGNHTALSV